MGAVQEVAHLFLLPGRHRDRKETGQLGVCMRQDGWPKLCKLCFGSKPKGQAA